ncbi:MAG: hypothetical protein AAFR61_00475 [Bacteroidota bacterium]
MVTGWKPVLRVMRADCQCAGLIAHVAAACSCGRRSDRLEAGREGDDRLEASVTGDAG